MSTAPCTSENTRAHTHTHTHTHRERETRSHFHFKALIQAHIHTRVQTHMLPHELKLYTLHTAHIQICPGIHIQSQTHTVFIPHNQFKNHIHVYLSIIDTICSSTVVCVYINIISHRHSCTHIHVNTHACILQSIRQKVRSIY